MGASSVRVDDLIRSMNRPFFTISAEEKVKYKEERMSIAKTKIFEESSLDNFDDWVGATPSKCNLEDGILKLIVQAPNAPVARNENAFEAARDEGIIEEFKALPKSDITTKVIHDFARRYYVNSGKWMIFIPWIEADKVWKTLVQALFDGKLVGVTSLAVDSRDDRPENVEGTEDTKINVANADYCDTKTIWDVERELRALGVTSDMKYKPDIYSVLNIMARNEYGIKVCPHTSLGKNVFAARGRGQERVRGGRGGRRGGRGQRFV